MVVKVMVCILREMTVSRKEDDRDAREVWHEFKRMWWEKAEGDSLRLLKATLKRFTASKELRQIMT